MDLQIFDQLDTLDSGSCPNISVSCLTSPKIGGFGRATQAIGLLDQVLKCFDIQDIESRLLLLDRIDTSIQAFLSLVMSHSQERPGVFCIAINYAIR